MTTELFEELRRELVNGYAKRRHPFRYFSLATVSNNSARQRTVVLRKMLADDTLLVYTDARSQKVSDIKANPNVSALFYHPKQLTQIRVEGMVQIVTDKDELKPYWNNIPDSSRKDYITANPPGTPTNNPDDVNYKDDENHFCMLKIIPKQFEYLKLKRPNHIRVLFSKSDDTWDGQFLVP